MEVLLRCLENHDNEFHDFVMTKPPMRCPKCGNEDKSSLIPLTRVYLLTPHKDGPIVGYRGKRYVIVSQPDKKACNPQTEAWSTEIRAVNNPACLRTKEHKALKDKEATEEFYRTGGLIVPSSFTEEQPEPAVTVTTG